MKKLILAFIPLLFIVGCSDTPKESPTTDIVSEKVKTATSGETCGGVEKKLCESGLDCIFDFDKSDARGRCVRTVIDEDLKCPKTQQPVCAIRGRSKNGYLNECEARRHGATILSEGFCQRDENVVGSCKTKAIGIGNCFKVTRGFEFDGKKCVEKNVGGCDAELPFPSKESCAIACVK
jgi:hypothetical protein